MKPITRSSSRSSILLVLLSSFLVGAVAGAPSSLVATATTNSTEAGSVSQDAPMAAAVAVVAGTPISPTFFGMNAWMPYQIGQRTLGGKLEKKLCGELYVPGGPCLPAEISEAGVQLLRYGGKEHDRSFDPSSSHLQHLAMVDNMRAVGAEPLLQVAHAAGQYTASQAAELVYFLNVTNGRNVRYWSIANEPNMLASPYNGTYGAAQIATYFRTFARAMKEVDPTIIITGVDLDSYAPSIMNPLTEGGGPDDITGTFVAANGRLLTYVDILNFHSYRFDGSPAQTRQAVIDYPAGGFEPKLIALKGRVDAANSYHDRTGSSALTVAVTEMNVNYRNPTYADSAATVEGVGATGYLAGQFLANSMNMGLKHGLAFMAFWSVSEGGGANHETDFGFVDNETGAKRSTYYHFQMMARNFRGAYAPATVQVNGAPKRNVTAFGAKDLDQIVVMILNQTRAGALAYTVRLDPAPVSGPKTLKVAVDAGLSVEYSNPPGEPLPAQSTVLLVFDPSGVLRSRTSYGLDHALTSGPPTVKNY